MKYLKKFQTHSEYQAHKSGNNFKRPTVSYCEVQDEIHYDPTERVLYDFNKDGKLDSEDISYFTNYRLTEENPNNISTETFDVNKDGIVNIYDVTAYIDKLYDISTLNNNHDYVDLDLPSGTLWAKRNIGAKDVTDYGLYFAWGETLGYDNGTEHSFNGSNYKYGDGSANLTGSKMTKYNSSDDLTVLKDEDDAARMYLGGKWHMPTEAQVQELLNNQYVTRTAAAVEVDGVEVNGILFTSVSNNKTLFIPAAGAYDGSTNNYVGTHITFLTNEKSSYDGTYGKTDCKYFDGNFNTSNFQVSSVPRWYGIPVRAVVAEQ